MQKLLNEWRSYLAEQSYAYDALAGYADKQPLRYVAAGVVVSMINQGHYPKKTQNFSWSRETEDITDQYQLKNAIKVIKDNFSEKHELAIAEPQLMKKLTPFLKQGEISSDAFLKLEKYFTPQTTAQVLKQNAAFSAIDMFLTAFSPKDTRKHSALFFKLRGIRQKKLKQRLKRAISKQLMIY